MNTVEYERVSSEEWDAFIVDTPQYNVFSCSSYLEMLPVAYDAWITVGSDGCKCGFLVIKDRESGDGLPSPSAYLMYNGLFWCRRTEELPAHSKYGKIGSFIDAFNAHASGVYSRYSFFTHHSVVDVRFFDWHNYHTPDQGKFKIETRYTGLIENALYPSWSDYFASIRKNRQRNYSRAVERGVRFAESSDHKAFVDIYSKTFLRQGIVVPSGQISLMADILKSSLKTGIGSLAYALSERGDVVSGTLFLNDDHCSYYLFGANDPDYFDLCGSSFLMLENIKRAMESGKTFVDCVGINSPTRGDFKISFNFDPRVYYVMNFCK